MGVGQMLTLMGLVFGAEKASCESIYVMGERGMQKMALEYVQALRFHLKEPIEGFPVREYEIANDKVASTLCVLGFDSPGRLSPGVMSSRRGYAILTVKAGQATKTKRFAFIGVDLLIDETSEPNTVYRSRTPIAEEWLSSLISRSKTEGSAD